MDKQSESDRGNELFHHLRLIETCLNRAIIYSIFQGTVGINDLPDEILQFVFVHLPLVDLLTLYSTVCKRWYRIISDSEVNRNF